MKKILPLYIVVFVLSFCSIVYELILAQTLSAFLANTVLRYSVTIGLYMFSMGIGVFILNKQNIKSPVRCLLNIELMLAVLGGFCVFLICFLDSLNLSRFLFQFGAHALIIGIGILTGFELPLLISIVAAYKKNSENVVLGINYFGAFGGSVAFAFIFYREIGLIGSAVCVGILNIFAGFLIGCLEKTDQCHLKKYVGRYFFFQFLLLSVFVYCLFNLNQITEYLTVLYLR